jgi:hypothetical protein
MIFLSVITLSFYYHFWYWSRINIFKKLDIKINLFFKVIIIVLICTTLLILVPGTIGKIALIFDFYLFILLGFRLKKALTDYCDNKNYEIYISKWLTFIFSIFYLQYKMNFLINSELRENDFA